MSILLPIARAGTFQKEFGSDDGLFSSAYNMASGSYLYSLLYI
jgi:hypothetical protein